MKVLQINKYFYIKGGAETVFFNTMDLLTEKGHTVIPFSLKSRKNRPSAYESYFVDYPELSESGLWTKVKYLFAFIHNRQAARKLKALLLAEKPDVAHIHLLFNCFSVSILPVLKECKVPVVMSVHDYRLICPAYTFIDGQGHFCERCKAKHAYHCIVHRCYRNEWFSSILLALDSYYRTWFIRPVELIDQFIFVSRFSRDKHISMDASFESKSLYLYNFTPLSDKGACLRSDYILFFGRISAEKGIPTLMKAMEQIPDVKLKIVGTGPLLEDLKKHSGPNIEFAGFQSGNELYDSIRKARFVIVPSQCYENNPLSVIESMTLGTPVIGSRIGGIPELIEEGRTGYIFDVKSAENLQQTIRKALSLPEQEYAAMSLAAKEFASEQFSGESHYRRLMAVYDSVITKQG
ncbi:MAG: glycosyltransferase family 4 protein [Tannerellaceae bacterium]|jgi:glycosyltransferase involved in cell wall biosynthesis|nr:glycosyltransferase family 4 protein [Tannerellaceae bacterium]